MGDERTYGLAPVESRIASDLKIARAVGETDLELADRILYPAMGEWLRTITFDADTTIGNAKVGVTKDYIINRGAEVLPLLARSILPETCKPCSQERALDQTTWMVDSMLFVGELFEPEKGMVAISTESASSGHYLDSHKRLIGRRDQIGPCVQAGLCRYAIVPVSEDDADAETEQRLTVERELAKAMPLLADKLCLGVDEGKTLREMVASGSYDVTDNGGSLIALHTGSALLSDKERLALLCGAWPHDEAPLRWSTATRWAIPRTIGG